MRITDRASVATPERYCFGAFELQVDERRLLKDGAAVPLQPRAFGVLATMVERAGHLIMKDELLERVWPKLVVEENALQSQISSLRRLLGPDAIATVSGQGYRFALPVAKVEPRANHNLPSQLTSFIGREQEIAHLKELVTSNRLVTLTGAGGAGKTRLAIEVASKVGDAFPDGAWMVELAPRCDPGLVASSVAEVLAQKEKPGKLLIDTLTEYLASTQMLLVLDNAEHLLDGCVQFIDSVLRRSTRVVILVTSRERLGIAGELTYRVPSLTAPGVNETPTAETVLGYEAVRLFVDRARLIRPTFAIATENAAAVASICSRLDGIPLAIELAAPRLRSMSIEELSQRLDHRFALLTDGSRTALPRHRTLRSMVDWSYDLLSKAERAMLSRVSVFAGGWALATAEQVCTGDGIEASTVIDLLTSLVDKNLVVAEEHDGVTRYRMLETVRQYAIQICEEHHGDVAGARRAAETRLSLEPKNPAAYLNLAYVHLIGEEGPQRVFELCTQAINLNPKHPSEYASFFIGMAYFMLADNDAAIEWLQKSLGANREIGFFYAYLAMAYALKGNDAKARATAADLRRVDPSVTLFAYRKEGAARPAAWQEWFESKLVPAWRKAGLPEK